MTLFLGVVQAQDTLRMVFSYRVSPDSLVALRVGGYGGYSCGVTEIRERCVFSYEIAPDSIVGLRVGGYGGFGGANPDVVKNGRLVFSYSIAPESLAALRVAGYGGFGGIDVESSARVRAVISYSIMPDSLIGLRVGGYGFVPATPIDESAQKRYVFTFSVRPDSLVALRVGGWGFSAGMNVDDSARTRTVFTFQLKPDRLVALRIAGYGNDTSGTPYEPRTRWVFSYAWAGSILVVVRSEPPGAVLYMDTLAFETESTFVWMFADFHQIKTDTLQRVLNGGYWYHFRYWLTTGGDTIYNADTTLYIATSDTITAWFSYEPTPAVLLKDGVWFDPYGVRREFKNPALPVEP